MILAGPPVIPVQEKRPLSLTHDGTLGCPGADASELPVRRAPLLEVGEQFCGHLDSGGKELAEQFGRGYAPGPSASVVKL